MQMHKNEGKKERLLLLFRFGIIICQGPLNALLLDTLLKQVGDKHIPDIRMRNIKKAKFVFIICALLVAILIFYFSAQTAETSKAGSRVLTDFVVKLVEPNYDKFDLLTQQALYGKVHHLIRKTAHLLMYIFVSILLMHYMIAKIIVAAIVMVWSFVSRKVFIEKKS